VKLNRLIFTFLVQLLCHLSVGQTTFEKIYSASIAPQFYKNSNLILLPDSGYVYTATNYGSILIGRLSKIGNVIWTKELSDPQQSNNSNIVLSPSNFLYITYWLNASFSSIVIKLDLNGNIIWTKKYTNGSGNLLSQNILATSSAIFITGQHYFGGLQDLYVQKIDTNGNFIWGKTYDAGTPDEYIYTSKQLKNKDILLSGSAVTGTNSYMNLLRVDTNGLVVANRRLRNTNYEFIDGLAVTEDQTGNIILTGRMDSLPGIGFGLWDIFLMKLNSNLNFQWGKFYGGANFDEGYSVFANHDNGYKIIAEPESFITSRIAMMKLDSLGNLQWTKLYGKTTGSFPNFCVMNKDRGFTILGLDTNYEDIAPMLLIKTDSLGNSTCPAFSVTLPQNSFTLIADSPLSLGTFSGTNTYTPLISNYALTLTDYCQIDNIKDFKMTIEKFTLYPNPFASSLTIKIPGYNRQKLDIEIRDFLGNVVFNQRDNLVPDYKRSIDLNNLSVGLYFITLSTDTEKVVRKITKE
jgi:hypothetical protein